MKSSLTLLFIILLFKPAGFAQYAWTQQTSMPVSRYIGCGFTIGTKSYVGTGYSSTAQALGDWWEYNQTTDVWTQKASTTTRSSATTFVINGKGYVGLGVRSSTFLTDLFEYDPATNVWTQKASLPAQGRFGAAGFSIGSTGYIACGNFGSASGPYTNEVFGYNALTNTWSAKAPFPGMVRYGGRAEVINNLGYVFGGINGTGTSTSSFFGDLWEYDPTLDSWLQKPDIPGLGRQYASVFVIDNKFVAGSGVHHTGFLSDFFAFDPLTNGWSALPSLPAAEARWAAVGFSNGTDGYIVSGNKSLNNPIVITNTLWKLSFVNFPPPVITSNGSGGNLGCNPTANDIENALGNASISGGCNAPISINVVTDPPVNTGGCNWSVTRTFTATDSCGNVADPVSVSVTYKSDAIAPNIIPSMSNNFIGCNPGITFLDQQLGDATTTDNCDASVNVSINTSTPVNIGGCYWSVTRTFDASDSCGNAATSVYVTVTYKSDNISPVITSGKTDENLGCKPSAALIEAYLGNATASDNCDASVVVSAATGNPVNTSGCTWTITRTFTATDSCGNSAVPVNVTVTYQLDDLAPVVTCNAGGNITICDGTAVNLTPFAIDDCDGNLTVNCTRSDGLALSDPFGQGTTTVDCFATDNCGNTGNCSMTVTVECNDNNGNYCTYTQGAYGSAGGAHCDGTTTNTFLPSLLSTPLIVGGGSNKLTLTAADVTNGCFYSRLPGGGPSAKLSGSATCSTPTGITLNGTKFKNTLLVQTITLGLNLRIPGSTLGNLELTGQYLTTYASTGTGCNSSTGVQIPGTAQSYVLPLSVITYLGANNKVSDLYDLANMALSGAYTGNNPSKSQIASAIDIINNAFDECRSFGEFSDVPNSKSELSSGSNPELLTVKVSPNPFTEEATINFMLDGIGSGVTVDIYNLTGQKIITLFNNYAEPDTDYNIKIDGSTLLPGVYFYYVKTGNSVYYDKLTLIK